MEVVITLAEALTERPASGTTYCLLGAHPHLPPSPRALSCSLGVWPGSGSLFRGPAHLTRPLKTLLTAGLVGDDPLREGFIQALLLILFSEIGCVLWTLVACVGELAACAERCILLSEIGYTSWTLGPCIGRCLHAPKDTSRVVVIECMLPMTHPGWWEAERTCRNTAPPWPCCLDPKPPRSLTRKECTSLTKPAPGPFFGRLPRRRDKTFFIAVLLALQQPKSAVFAGTFGALAIMTVISGGPYEIFHLKHLK